LPFQDYHQVHQILLLLATPLNDASFTVNWTILDHSYNYTVIWTNLNTGVVDNFTVPRNASTYTVIGLSEYYDNYNVSVAVVGLCGMKTSNPITVYGTHLHKCMYATQVHMVCTYVHIKG